MIIIEPIGTAWHGFGLNSHFHCKGASVIYTTKYNYGIYEVPLPFMMNSLSLLPGDEYNHGLVFIISESLN